MICVLFGSKSGVRRWRLFGSKPLTLPPYKNGREGWRVSAGSRTCALLALFLPGITTFAVLVLFALPMAGRRA